MVKKLVSRSVCEVVGRVFEVVRSDFPNTVRVETTNACNARCIICPHKFMGRDVQRMDERLYQRIVEECVEGGCREMHLHNFGEPLLDRQLEARIRHAKQRGVPHVKVFSNGSLLSEDRARGLISSGLDQIKISIDGVSKEEFERIRYPLKFDRVIENIRRLVALRNAAQSPLRIHVACCSTSDKTATMAALEGVVDGFSFGKIHNWANTEHASGAEGIRKPCSRLWRTFTILANGDISLCCLDYDGQHVIGRLDEGMSIRTIWNSVAYRQLRRLHTSASQEAIDLCSNCSKSFLVRKAVSETADQSSPKELPVLYQIADRTSGRPVRQADKPPHRRVA